MMKIILAIMSVLAALLVTLVTGCSISEGGTNTTTTPVVTGETGSIVINISWPVESREIPLGTKSIKVAIAQTNADGSTMVPAGKVASLYANKGVSGTLDFGEVPIGYYTIAGSAWDEINGAGNLLGSASISKFQVLAATYNHASLVLRRAINLGMAGNFVILAKSKVSTTGTTAVVGNVGISPAARSYLTGFADILDASGQFSTSTLVTGRLYAADMAIPTPGNMTIAVGDMEAAYTDAAGRTLPDYMRVSSVGRR